MSSPPRPALSPEQWEARDYRQPARELDAWAATRAGRRPDHDPTEYVAKLGLSDDDCVILMSRAHDRVLVPPPARAALAAFALAGQPFGFTPDDVAALRRAARALAPPDAATLAGLADRIEALLPPAGPTAG